MTALGKEIVPEYGITSIFCGGDPVYKNPKRGGNISDLLEVPGDTRLLPLQRLISSGLVESVVAIQRSDWQVVSCAELQVQAGPQVFPNRCGLQASACHGEGEEDFRWLRDGCAGIAVAVLGGLQIEVQDAGAPTASKGVPGGSHSWLFCGVPLHGKADGGHGDTKGWLHHNEGT